MDKEDWKWINGILIQFFFFWYDHRKKSLESVKPDQRKNANKASRLGQPPHLLPFYHREERIAMRYLLWTVAVAFLVFTLAWDKEMVKAAVTGGVVVLWAKKMIEAFWKK